MEVRKVRKEVVEKVERMDSKIFWAEIKERKRLEYLCLEKYSKHYTYNEFESFDTDIKKGNLVMKKKFFLAIHNKAPNHGYLLF